MVDSVRMIAHVVLGLLLFFGGLSKRGSNEAILCTETCELFSAESCRHKVPVYVDEITQHTAVLYWKNVRHEGIRDYKVYMILDSMCTSEVSRPFVSGCVCRSEAVCDSRG